MKPLGIQAGPWDFTTVPFETRKHAAVYVSGQKRLAGRGAASCRQNNEAARDQIGEFERFGVA